MIGDDISAKVRAVLEALATLALLWFCLWLGTTEVHIRDGVDRIDNAISSIAATRSANNARNIAVNTNRIDQLENAQ